MSALYVTEQGGGRVEQSGEKWTLSLPSVTSIIYCNAMLTSYGGRSDFSFGPGTSLQLTAYASTKTHGTAGFGFWNHPYGRGLRMPRALWFFFSSPPNNMPLALGVPGSGFKASVFDAQRWQFIALAPAAPLGMLFMRVPALYRFLWPIGQRAIGVDEFALDTAILETSHRYAINWHKEYVTFAIDDNIVFKTKRVPKGKLGFVAWLDNQYAIVTPQGKFRFGLIDAVEPQHLVIDAVSLTTG